MSGGAPATLQWHAKIANVHDDACDDDGGAHRYIWARDTANAKMYTCTRSVRDFYDYCFDTVPADRRHFYEIIAEGPCAFYLDIDALVWPDECAHAPDAPLDDIRARTHALLRELAEFCRAHYDLALDLRALTALDSSALAVTPDAPHKFSLHVLVPFAGPMRDAALRTNAHCGAIMRAFALHCWRQCPSLETNPYFYWRDRARVVTVVAKRSNREFLADLGVYTRQRQMRVWLSSKIKAATRPRVLKLADARTLLPLPDQRARLSLEMFEATLVSRPRAHTLIDTHEHDGAPPVSTNRTLANLLESTSSVPSAARARAVVVQPTPAPHLHAHWAKNFDFDGWFRWLHEYAAPPRMWGVTSASGVTATLPRDEWFRSADAWRAHALQRTPSAYHVGAGADGAQELVLDFDVTDLPGDTSLPRCDTCTCTPGDAVCAACLSLLYTSAMLYIDFLRALFDDAGQLGDAHVFFSGCKGVHVWFRSCGTAALVRSARGALATLLARDAVARAAVTETAVWNAIERWFVQPEAIEHVPALSGRMQRVGGGGGGGGVQDALKHLLCEPDMQVLTGGGGAHCIKVPDSVHARTRRVATRLPVARRPSEIAAAVAQPYSQSRCGHQ